MHGLPFPRHRIPWLAALPAALAGLALAAPDVATPVDPKQAAAEFEAVSGEMKKLVGELAVIQAKYQQPGADKPALEARFEETRQKAQAGAERLEEAAFQLVAADPKHSGAREICGAVIATSLQGDDAQRALAAATRLEQIGAADESTLLMAASAALVASDVDAAKSFLAKATAAGAPQARTSELAEAIEREGPKIEAEQAKRKADAAADDLPRVKLATTAGDLVIELFENEAPNTVANFISLVEQGFYDGTPFHRVIGGFMAQGGDPTGSGRGGPGYAIPCEVGEPGARKHFLGSLSMAHAGPDTGGSQFFLTFRPTDHLDGKHTVFGRVIEGFDVLPRLIRTQDGEGRPVPGVNPDKITKAEVIRKRNHPYEPKKLPDPRK